ncbi:unnamed protein product [Sphagnum jensenii]|uniref:Enkurin domain-containing protein n=1 Tax=Sphagnum jensenii TaxID=128206 RepID=A0ABP0X2L9_9BRYO
MAWESKESVYKIIKPPVESKPRTPPPTVAMIKERKVAKLILRLKQAMKEKMAATFGKLPGSFKPSTSKFLKKHSKEPIMVYKVDRCSVKDKPKPPIPLEPPKHGLSSGCNWITVNAVKAIRSKANTTGCPKKKRRYVTKKNYGKIPEYLEKRMETEAQIKRESIVETANCKHDDTHRLEESERIEMMNNLKLKWAATNAQYQALSFCLDTISKIKRKERYERNLANLEKDVTLLSRKVILVSNSAPEKVKKESAGGH